MKKVLLLLLPFLLSMQAGVQYTHLQPNIHVLEVDPEKVVIQPVHAGDQILALETVSSMAQRYHAVAAVNGGFFRMPGEVMAGSSSGLLKIGGKYFSSPRAVRGAVGWSGGGKDVLMDRLNWRGVFFLFGKQYLLQGINQPPADEKAILYTWKYEPLGMEMISAGNGEVIGIGPKYEPKVPLRAEVQYTNRVQPIFEPEKVEGWNNFENIVGGAPLLVSNGVVITDFSPENTRVPFLLLRYTRTAVGVKEDGHWIFAVVDGEGMTMAELAECMHSLGCKYALNLDGGGSSTMYFDGQVMNMPIDEDNNARRERPVSDAILVLEAA